MKEPGSKLPWIVEQEDNTFYWVVSEEDGEVMSTTLHDDTKQDAEYIVEACNLFPECVILLRNILDTENLSEDYIVKINTLLSKIDEKEST